MKNYRIEIEYDGTDFSGWQIQPNASTVQETIEKGLSVILKEPVKIIGASRTDAGVHASYQVANFYTKQEFEIRRMFKSINSILPKTIAIKNLEQVDKDFHSRYSASYRQYVYRIRTQKVALNRNLCWINRYDIDWDMVEKSSKLIIGEHDFSAFCSAGSSAVNKVCNVSIFSLEKERDEILFHIRANRFLYKMVRSLVGTLVDIGRNRIPPDSLAKALETGDRNLVGNTAPASGLTLVDIGY